MENYKLTPEADNDLTEIWQDGFKKWGLKQANTYLLQLEERFEKLFEFPGLGVKRDEIRMGYRSYRESSHLVFYRKNNNKLEVIRILHKRMDIDSVFESNQS